MGKKLIIKGADFFNFRIDQTNPDSSGSSDTPITPDTPTTVNTLASFKRNTQLSSGPTALGFNPDSYTNWVMYIKLDASNIVTHGTYPSFLLDFPILGYTKAGRGFSIQYNVANQSPITTSDFVLWYWIDGISVDSTAYVKALNTNNKSDIRFVIVKQGNLLYFYNSATNSKSITYQSSKYSDIYIGGCRGSDSNRYATLDKYEIVVKDRLDSQDLLNHFDYTQTWTGQ